MGKPHEKHSSYHLVIIMGKTNCRDSVKLLLRGLCWSKGSVQCYQIWLNFAPLAFC